MKALEIIQKALGAALAVVFIFAMCVVYVKADRTVHKVERHERPVTFCTAVFSGIPRELAHADCSYPNVRDI